MSSKKRKILKVLYILIAVIAATAIYFYLTLPPWKAVFILGSGIVLIINLVFAIFFIKRNFKG